VYILPDLCYCPQPISRDIRENLYVDVAGSLLLFSSAEGIGPSQSTPQQLQNWPCRSPFADIGATMSTRDRVDRESFQSLLANAFSVQQSGMTPQSLTSIIEIQRTISKDDIAIDSALRLIADRAQAVGNASGIGIALLQENRLVHRAGIGSASQLVGSQLAAVFSATVNGHPRREILRVENASTDSRIEADICRQFDAQALLMVPIYREGSVIGVLEILFSQPHRFIEAEVRSYQLMATLAGDATLLPAQVVQQKGVSYSTVSRALWRMSSRIQQLRVASQPAPQARQRQKPAPGSVQKGATPSIRQWRTVRHMSQLAKAVTESLQTVSLPRLRWPDFSLTTFSWQSSPFRGLQVRIRNLGWRARTARIQLRSDAVRNVMWNVAAVSLLLVLAVGASILHHKNSVSRAGNASSQTATPVLAPAVPAVSDSTALVPVSKPQAQRSLHDVNAPNAGFTRVRVGKDEIDYVSDDVTVRHFHSVSPTAESHHHGPKQVNIGRDVTVRYFTRPQSMTTAQPTSLTDESLRD
jgi:putative methionine-R-sulfoxide reductase with GAF domain